MLNLKGNFGPENPVFAKINRVVVDLWPRRDLVQRVVGLVEPLLYIDHVGPELVQASVAIRVTAAATVVVHDPHNLQGPIL